MSIDVSVLLANKLVEPTPNGIGDNDPGVMANTGLLPPGNGLGNETWQIPDTFSAQLVLLSTGLIDPAPSLASQQSANQTITPTGFTADLYGVPQLDQVVLPAGLDAEVFGNTLLSRTVAPVGLDAAQVGTALLAETISPAGLDAAQVGTALLAETIAPIGFDAASIGTAQLNQAVLPAGLDAAALGSAQLLQPPDQAITPAGLDATLFGQPSAGAQVFVLPQGGSGDNSARSRHRPHNDTVDLADLEEVLTAFIELELAA